MILALASLYCSGNSSFCKRRPTSLSRKRGDKVLAKSRRSSNKQASKGSGGTASKSLWTSEVAKQMGAKYQLEVERAVTEAGTVRRPAAGADIPPERGDAAELAEQQQEPGGSAAPERAARRQVLGLQVQAGEALSSFDARCYPLCFTEFFYGDCAPNLERTAPLTFKQIFSYLPVREELEYALDSDVEPYRAKAMCRWDRPKFAMVFGSILRSLRLLQSTKMALGGAKHETTFKKDLSIIAKASAEDFERARAVLGNEGSVIGAFTSPRVKCADTQPC